MPYSVTGAATDARAVVLLVVLVGDGEDAVQETAVNGREAQAVARVLAGEMAKLVRDHGGHLGAIQESHIGQGQVQHAPLGHRLAADQRHRMLGDEEAFVQADNDRVGRARVCPLGDLAHELPQARRLMRRQRLAHEQNGLGLVLALGPAQRAIQHLEAVPGQRQRDHGEEHAQLDAAVRHARPAQDDDGFETQQGDQSAEHQHGLRQHELRQPAAAVLEGLHKCVARLHGPRRGAADRHQRRAEGRGRQDAQQQRQGASSASASCTHGCAARNNARMSPAPSARRQRAAIAIAR